MNATLVSSIEKYQWHSEDQKKSYLALLKHLRDNGVTLPLYIDEKDAFFIQKIHDMNEYWRNVVDVQSNQLRNDIVTLMDKIRELNSKV